MTLKINNITKLFGTQKALNNVSFTVKKGEVTGFLGPNGAGKSTLMKIITGFLPPDSGQVFIHNELMTAENTNLRNNIGYLPENNPLYPDLFVKESLEITAGFYKLKDKKKRVAEMVELTGLGDEQHKKIEALSKGYRQRVGLAQALIHSPSVLILDEPTTGLDPNQLGEIRNLIREISREKTVILSSHIMQEVEAVCNRALIINKGNIVADGGIAEIKSAGLKNKQLVTAEFSEPVKLEKLLELKGVSTAVKKGNLWEVESDGSSDLRPVLFRFAVQNNLVLLALQEKQHNLENVFQQLTRQNES